ncbi:MAG: single-stranded DNA-binding protein [Bifidobacteriaceae bacterium]|jgi:single-strand DNA-binding protein|nr:single-stranded DNA-binding protein [Bifidobacteriaceae bacterium]
MSRNNTIEVTIRGRVAADPILLTATNRSEFAKFRIATTPRVFDRAAGEWADGQTEWLNITVFGTPFAQNVVKSLHKGQPVIVGGMLTTGTWTDREGEVHTELRLLAKTVGHDLFWGRSDFYRVAEAPAPAHGAAGSEEVPADEATPAIAGNPTVPTPDAPVGGEAPVGDGAPAPGWDGLDSAA